MSTVQHSYHYLAPSSISTHGRPGLTLATSSNAKQGHPHFFDGELKHPRLSAELLSAVHLIVGSRFFIPPNTLARLIALADPIVTSGGGLLRFEGFSSCCSTYIRVDLLPASYDGDIVGKGTTNVDFNAAMRAALAGVRDAAGLSLAVGAGEVRLRSGSIEVVEKKVVLPVRWIRGLLEVQAYHAAMRKRIQIKGIEALRFIRSLPKTATGKTPLWMVPGPAGLRTTTRPEPGGVRIADTSRLRVLESLLPKALSMTIFADDQQQANSWVLDFGHARLTLTLSAEVWRGFSGEGQALHALLHAEQSEAFAGVRAQLQWQAALDAQMLADNLGFEKTQIESALCILGSSGLVGFDVAENSYFHRVLPFDLTLVEDLHPRLGAARALVEQGAVTIVRTNPFEALVQSAGVEHRVREFDEEFQCTCPWFAKYLGARGPCKHVLAAQFCRAYPKEP